MNCIVFLIFFIFLTTKVIVAETNTTETSTIKLSTLESEPESSSSSSEPSTQDSSTDASTATGISLSTTIAIEPETSSTVSVLSTQETSLETASSDSSSPVSSSTTISETESSSNEPELSTQETSNESSTTETSISISSTSESESSKSSFEPSTQESSTDASTEISMFLSSTTNPETSTTESGPSTQETSLVSSTLDLTNPITSTILWTEKSTSIQESTTQGSSTVILTTETTTVISATTLSVTDSSTVSIINTGSNPEPPFSTETTTTALTTTTNKPPPPPPTGSYRISDSKGIECIKMDFSAQIFVEYDDVTTGKKRTEIVNVPQDAMENGLCGENINFTWSAGNSIIRGPGRKLLAPMGENALQLTIVHDGVLNVYFISAAEYFLLKSQFPGISGDPSSYYKSYVSGLRAFETPVGKSYACSNEALSKDFGLKFYELKFEAFNSREGHDFSKAVLCSRDTTGSSHNAPSIVGIAVGVSVTIVVFVAIGSVLVVRHRNRRRKVLLHAQSCHDFS